MDKFFTFRFTKAFTAVIFMMASIATNAQVSPYSLSPDWAYGQGGRMTFPNGNFPTSGAPTQGSRLTNTSNGPEASTSICFRDGSVAFYTNTLQLYNGTNSAGWWDFTRDFTSAADLTCAGSSTGGGVAFPDPANNATNDAFYIVLSNDLTSGGCPNKGFNRYRFTGTGATVAYNAGPTNIAPTTFVGEAITACTDGTGGYWVIGHNKTNVNTFRVWHYTAGGITGPTDYTVAGAVADVSGSQSYLKVSPCQDKIAYHAGGTVVVHAFDRTTGVVGALLDRYAPSVDYGVGLEFSPDGNKVYFCGQGSIVKWFTVGSSATSNGTVAGSTSWSMQLGPDGKIYTSGVGGTTIGYISNANGAATFTSLAMPGGSVFRGLANEAWLSPQTPAITNSGACSVTFGIDFKNYFNTQVSINTATIQWDFNGDNVWETAYNGQATPTFDYSTIGDGPYTVKLRFNDTYCGQTWNVSKAITTTCPMPVDWLSVNADIVTDGVNISWATSHESNTSYFVVQRSQDGREFTNIGTTPAAGNSNTIRQYSFMDSNPFNGASYYRILQYDVDGKSTGSRIVAVNLSNVSLNVFPNPSEGQFDIELSGAGSAQLTVTDVLGRVVYTNSLQGDYVSTRFGDDLGKGTYVLTVVTPTKTLHEKLVKE